MIVECCSQERSYSQFYGLVGERFSKLNRVWCENFEEAFANYYDTIHRYETNRLRNIARFFGHLLASDSISWAVLSAVKMNEDDTTSSSRIFIKILMQEMMEEMGLASLTARFKDPTLAGHFTQLFPLDNPKNTRFSINYFTSIGLGAVTEAMREHLKVSFFRDHVPNALEAGGHLPSSLFASITDDGLSIPPLPILTIPPPVRLSERSPTHYGPTSRGARRHHVIIRFRHGLLL